MKYLVNGQEWEPAQVGGVKVERGTDRLFVHTKAGCFSALAVRSAGSTHVSYRGRTYRIERPGRKRAEHDLTAGGEARAPMPGQIVEVSCKVGDRVRAGERLLVLEAMKMQQPVTAPVSGTVSALSVSQGDQVVEGQSLVVVTPEGAR